MARPIIEAKNISKSYTIGKRESYGSLRDEIMQALSSPFRRSANTGADDSTVWALKDVSFDVAEGEVLGIIGRNGAGKSTLLKILSRITEPTAGRIVLRGRVASLLEVGTGFHPELTGRENIFLNGSLLGMNNREIRSKFDEIVAFSEIDKFLDTPVKRYSSGMYVRLAFAVAAHLEPEILIVDEVLAVGDASFQKKCLGKMGDVAKGGRTVLFVSHNMGAVRSLCSSGVLISGGRVEKTGPAGEVVDRYLTAGTESDSGEVHWPDSKTAPGGKELRLRSIRVVNGQDSVLSSFNADEPINIEITYELFEQVSGMRIIFKLVSSDGVLVFTSIDFMQPGEKKPAGVHRATCTIPEGLLNAGQYLIWVQIGCPGVKVLVQGREFLGFQTEKVVHTGWLANETLPGVVSPGLRWRNDQVRD